MVAESGIRRTDGRGRVGSRSRWEADSMNKVLKATTGYTKEA
jgi:hypothetical protein